MFFFLKNRAGPKAREPVPGRARILILQPIFYKYLQTRYFQYVDQIFRQHTIYLFSKNVLKTILVRHFFSFFQWFYELLDLSIFKQFYINIIFVKIIFFIIIFFHIFASTFFFPNIIFFLSRNVIFRNNNIINIPVNINSITCYIKYKNALKAILECLFMK